MQRRAVWWPLTRVDRWLIMGLILIMTIGLIMVTSSSFALSQRMYGVPWYFALRQTIHLMVGLCAGYLVCWLPIEWLRQHSSTMLLCCFGLLLLVLIPGIGIEVNGSRRWINLGLMRFQVSEMVKLGFIIYFADYMVRFNHELQHSVIKVSRPLLVVASLGVLLLCEPDFGATVVMMSCAFGLLYLAGVPWRFFMVLLLAAGLMFACLAVSSPYRLQRLTAFLNPWANQFDSGYQLTQSLIAFGRAGFWGLGLGEGIQKLFYLPEAHTDFIFAILTEELGLMGALMLLLLFTLCIVRSLWIGHEAHRQQKHYHGFLAQGIALLLGMQVCISVGVNTGLLPTKGLTLPFVSYGGSSLVSYCVAVALLLRVYTEIGEKRGVRQ